MIIDAFFQCLLMCGPLFEVALFTLFPMCIVLLTLCVIRSLTDV